MMSECGEATNVKFRETSCTAHHWRRVPLQVLSKRRIIKVMNMTSADWADKEYTIWDHVSESCVDVINTALTDDRDVRISSFISLHWNITIDEFLTPCHVIICFVALSDCVIDTHRFLDKY